MRSLVSIALLLLLSAGGCEKQDLSIDLPFVYVYERIPLNDLRYKDLWSLGGHAYVDAGLKGIVIYHESESVFRAYERACPYDFEKDCARVSLDGSGLYFIDKCCNSTYSFGGNATGGPAHLPLKEYSSFIANNELVILNE